MELHSLRILELTLLQPQSLAAFLPNARRRPGIAVSGRDEGTQPIAHAGEVPWGTHATKQRHEEAVSLRERTQ